MAAVVLLGSPPPSMETGFPRSYCSPIEPFRGSSKARLIPQVDTGHGWSPRRESSASSAAPASSSASRTCGCGGGGGFFDDGGPVALRAARIGYSAGNCKPGSANFARGGFSAGAESDEEDEDQKREWEEQLRSRLKELEEMKELERRAEEVQRRIMSDEGGEEGETEEEKRERVRKELEKLAKEQAERRETAKLMFDLGQKAYGKGMYSRAVEFLEGALTIIPRPTLLGGEIQIWLAMAYEANNRHRDCIELYKQLEKAHPSVSIRRQAAELRYILQAPKLKISREEMVTIPLIGSSYDRYAGTWTDKNKDRDQKRKSTAANQASSSEDYWGDFIGWRPSTDWQRDRALWLAVTLLLAMIGFALLQS